MFYFDPIYFLFIAPALLLSLWASWRTKSAFNKFSKVPNARGITGAQAAAAMLQNAGINDVQIVPTGGMLSDHYNPLNKTLALSEPVYSSRSIAAVGVACHEAGHAVQHATHYAPLWLRSTLVPTASIGSNLSWVVLFLGFLLHSMGIVLLGIALFSAVVIFQIITLPVEFDASARAKKLAFEQGIVLANEREGVAKVLNAAALTYVAAVVSSLSTLLYYLYRAGLLGGRRS